MKICYCFGINFALRTFLFSIMIVLAGQGFQLEFLDLFTVTKLNTLLTGMLLNNRIENCLNVFFKFVENSRFSLGGDK